MAEKSESNLKTKLKRSLGLWELTLTGIGIILGAGIYALIGKAAGIAGNATWISFLIAGIISAFTALSYAELSSMFPRSGAEYVYVGKTFGRRLAFLVGWMIIIGTVLAAATVSLGFAGYLSVFLPLLPLTLAAAGLIALSTLINVYGVKESATIGAIFSIVEAVGLILIIIIGLPYLGSVDYFQAATDGTFNLFGAAALVFFAYIGFESIPRLSEEAKEPEKNVPTATLLSLAISTVIYVLVAIVAVSVVPWEALASSNAPLADVANVVFGGNMRTVLVIFALFATANTVLLMLVTDARLLYGMTESGILPATLGSVHKKRKTPWIAALAIGALSLALVFIGDIVFLANSTNFTVLVTFATINLSVIWLSYTEPTLRRPFISPRAGRLPVTALMGAATSILLLCSTGIVTIISGLLVALIGFIVYLFLNRGSKAPTQGVKA
jgi:APA family basic amino acid/polyamine antiporter